MNKTFTYEITWTVPEVGLRNKFVHEKWHDLSASAIIIGFSPFLFEHSNITDTTTIISVTAYKQPWFVRLFYFLSHHRGYSFPLWWRRRTK
jgi:hypothetical protein